MDAFIKSFSELSEQLLPIIGAIALVCLVVLLIKLIKIFANLNVTVDKANKTVDSVNGTLDKVQAPLDTVVKISHTVDKAHDATLAAVAGAKDLVIKTAEAVKDKIKNSDDSSADGEGE